MSNVSDPTGLPYAGGGPTVNDDGTATKNPQIRIVGAGTDTTSLTAIYDDTPTEGDALVASESAPTLMGNRSAGQNSGTGFATV